MFCRETAEAALRESELLQSRYPLAVVRSFLLPLALTAIQIERQIISRLDVVGGEWSGGLFSGFPVRDEHGFYSDPRRDEEHLTRRRVMLAAPGFALWHPADAAPAQESCRRQQDRPREGLAGWLVLCDVFSVVVDGVEFSGELVVQEGLCSPSHQRPPSYSYVVVRCLHSFARYRQDLRFTIKQTQTDDTP